MHVPFEILSEPEGGIDAGQSHLQESTGAPVGATWIGVIVTLAVTETSSEAVVGRSESRISANAPGVNYAAAQSFRAR